MFAQKTNQIDKNLGLRRLVILLGKLNLIFWQNFLLMYTFILLKKNTCALHRLPIQLISKLNSHTYYTIFSDFRYYRFWL